MSVALFELAGRLRTSNAAGWIFAAATSLAHEHAATPFKVSSPNADTQQETISRQRGEEPIRRATCSVRSSAHRGEDEDC